MRLSDFVHVRGRLANVCALQVAVVARGLKVLTGIEASLVAHLVDLHDEVRVSVTRRLRHTFVSFAEGSVFLEMRTHHLH